MPPNPGNSSINKLGYLLSARSTNILAFAFSPFFIGFFLTLVNFGDNIANLFLPKERR